MVAGCKWWMARPRASSDVVLTVGPVQKRLPPLLLLRLRRQRRRRLLRLRMMAVVMTMMVMDRRRRRRWWACGNQRRRRPATAAAAAAETVSVRRAKQASFDVKPAEMSTSLCGKMRHDKRSYDHLTAQVHQHSVLPKVELEGHSVDSIYLRQRPTTNDVTTQPISISASFTKVKVRRLINENKI